MLQGLCELYKTPLYFKMSLFPYTNLSLSRLPYSTTSLQRPFGLSCSDGLRSHDIYHPLHCILVSSPPAAVQPPPVQPHPTPAQPRPPALQPPTPTTPTNHMKRLRSGNCREDWILPPKKSSSISEEEEVFTLPQLVEEHSKNFPLSVMVVKGLEEHFPPRSVVDVCFLKQTQV